MINLKVRSEYSFRYAFGKLDDVIKTQKQQATLTDRGTTFGHVKFFKACKKQGIKSILGVELAFCQEPKLKVKQKMFWVTLLARNQAGLSEIYRLTSLSTKYKYYENRLGFDDLGNISENVIIIIEDASLQKYISHEHTYYGISPIANYKDIKDNKLKTIAISDNLYCYEEERNLYEIILGKGVDKFSPCQDREEKSHILSEEEWKKALWFLTEEEKQIAIDNTHLASELIGEYDLPQSELPDNDSDVSLKDLCLIKAKERNIDLTPIYLDRLELEIQVIEQKNFTNYFFLVADIVNYAKQHMLVGPARGSSAGSLVCYLLGITEVDPIKFDLLFARFLDPNRTELPDIDIDFQDTKRDLIFEYLKEKYGEQCVAKLGVISQYKPRSVLTEMAKIIGIAQYQIEDLKQAVPETDAGDSRNMLEKTFIETNIGKDFINKYPSLIHAKDIEGHARHHGQHAAAILVSKKPLTNYASIDYINHNCQLDKFDAEDVNLLKIDCLSLRTLTVIKNCLDEIGKDREWLLNYPLDDQKAFDIVNNKKYHGIFQFEGGALISVAKQMNITEFNDLVAITSLARPGTLINGEANRYARNKNEGVVEYAHPILEPILKETHGIIVYQEQVMKIVREVGNFSWEETSKIRKAIGKSMGSDYINKMKHLFIQGCQANNVDEFSAEKIWQNILDMGSYTFNKSHAVAYAMLSYWCMILKAYHPLEFALATLKDSKDDDQTIFVLRELVKEGFEYKVFDKDLSEIDWSIKDGKLIGGFINIKGVAEKKATKLIEKRKTGKAFTAVESRLMYDGETPFDSLFEFKDKFSGFYDNWSVFFKEKYTYLKDIEGGQEVRFLAKSALVKQKDINDPYQLEKRDGRRIETGCQKFVDITFVDDTDSVKCRISRENYEAFGADILKDKVGTHYLAYGKCCDGFKFVFINEIRKTSAKEIEKSI